MFRKILMQKLYIYSYLKFLLVPLVLESGDPFCLCLSFCHFASLPFCLFVYLYFCLFVFFRGHIRINQLEAKFKSSICGNIEGFDLRLGNQSNRIPDERQTQE